jgi:putative pyrroloquinoline-quinone binding quinoprotein
MAAPRVGSGKSPAASAARAERLARLGRDARHAAPDNDGQRYNATSRDDDREGRHAPGAGPRDPRRSLRDTRDDARERGDSRDHDATACVSGRARWEPVERTGVHPPARISFTPPAVDWCATFSSFEQVRYIPGKLYMGGPTDLDPVEKSRGWLTAVDASTGAVKWKYQSPRPMVAAVTTTAGKVVMTGELTGDFVVFDARTGGVLYRFNTGGPSAAASSPARWPADSTWLWRRAAHRTSGLIEARARRRSSFLHCRPMRRASAPVLPL